MWIGIALWIAQVGAEASERIPAFAEVCQSLISSDAEDALTRLAETYEVLLRSEANSITDLELQNMRSKSQRFSLSASSSSDRMALEDGLGTLAKIALLLQLDEEILARELGRRLDLLLEERRTSRDRDNRDREEVRRDHPRVSMLPGTYGVRGFSADGTSVIALVNGADNLALIDARTGERRMEFPKSTLPVVFSPTGRTFAWYDRRRQTVFVQRVSDLAIENELSFHIPPDQELSFRYHPDERWIVAEANSRGPYKTLHFLDLTLAKGRPITLPPLKAAKFLRFRDGSVVFLRMHTAPIEPSVESVQAIQEFDLRSGEAGPTVVLSYPTRVQVPRVFDEPKSVDGWVQTNQHSQISVWQIDIESGRLHERFACRPHDLLLGFRAMSDSSAWLATGRAGGATSLWDLSWSRERPRLVLPYSDVRSVQISPNAKVAAVVQFNSRLRLIALPSGEELFSDTRPLFHGRDRQTFSNDGEKLLIQGIGGELELWDLSTLLD